MTKTEIKKALYREKPKASLASKTHFGREFATQLSNGEFVYFYVPLSELTPHHVDGMEAQLLIRWITNE